MQVTIYQTHVAKHTVCYKLNHSSDFFVYHYITNLMGQTPKNFLSKKVLILEVTMTCAKNDLACEIILSLVA